MHMYIYMYDSTSTEGHTCSAHMTILILSVHIYDRVCLFIEASVSIFSSKMVVSRSYMYQKNGRGYIHNTQYLFKIL